MIKANWNEELLRSHISIQSIPIYVEAPFSIPKLYIDDLVRIAKIIGSYHLNLLYSRTPCVFI